VSATTTGNCHTTQAQEPQLPPVGSWAWVEGKLAQVVKHHEHGADFRGEGIHGVYRSYQLLTETEMLQNGLSWHTIL